MNKIKRINKVWSSLAILLGIALILTAWLPTDLSAGSKGHAFGKADTTGNSGINKSPQDASTKLDAKKIEQGNRINPGGPVQICTDKGCLPVQMCTGKGCL